MRSTMREKLGFGMFCGFMLAFAVVLCLAFAEPSSAKPIEVQPIEAQRPATVLTVPQVGICLGGQVSEVTDGDTLKFKPDSIEIKVRLDECWAEESRGELAKRTAKGAKASADLKSLAEGKRGRLFIPGSKRLADALTLDRVLGRVWLDGSAKDLSTIQVEKGNATREKPKSAPGGQASGFRQCRNPLCCCSSCACGLRCRCDVAEKAPEYIRPQYCAAKAEPGGLELLDALRE